MNAARTVGLPAEIRLGDERRRLRLAWEAGPVAELAALTLRRACRCSTCSAQRQRGVEPQAPADIRIREVLPAGVAGVQLIFDDGHQRGIYPWDYLVSLSEGDA